MLMKILVIFLNINVMFVTVITLDIYFILRSIRITYTLCLYS